MSLELIRDLRAALEAAKKDAARTDDELMGCKLRLMHAENMFIEEHRWNEVLRRQNSQLRGQLAAAESKRMDLQLGIARK